MNLSPARRALKLAPLDILDTVFFRRRMERGSREALFQAGKSAIDGVRQARHWC
jgi:hypothetical protein